jgi:hypothetical protein
MPITLRTRVIGIGVDNDPFTGLGYTSVQLGVESDVPAPPAAQNQYPPIVRVPIFKHVLHIFVPTNEWRNQYNMWSQYDMTVEDDGQLRLIRVNERQNHVT